MVPIASVLPRQQDSLIEINAAGGAHRPWYDRQRPPFFAAALKAAKATLDPQVCASTSAVSSVCEVFD